MKGNSLKYLTREGARNLWVNRMMTLASVTVLLACLVIIGIGGMTFFNLSELLDRVESQNVIMVFAKQDADDSAVSQLGLALKQLDNTSQCEFIPKEDAFKQQIDSLGADNAIFEGIKENPLPDAYKVTLKDLSLFSKSVEQIKGLESVDSVRENSDLANKLLSIRKAISVVSIGLFTMLFLVALFIISNTIRITMFSRKLEINIMKAVGATPSFIRWPFMIEGVLIGIISGTISFGILWGIYALIVHFFSTAISAFGFQFVPFTSYAVDILLLFLGIGIFTGAFGSLVSMNKYLKEQGSVVSNE